MNQIFSLALALPFFWMATGGMARGQEEPAELAQARATYQRDLEFSIRPIRDRYVSKLDALKRSLGSRGDARGAAAIQDEIDRVRTSAGAPNLMAKLVGVWQVKYQPTGTRRYRITAEGTLKYEEGNGLAILPPQEWKIFKSDEDLLVDHGDGVVERLSMKGSTLITEIFAPKTLYPKGPVNAQGTGKLLSHAER